MVDTSPTDERDAQLLTRRRTAAGIATVSLGGLSVVAAGSDTASAEVTMGEFTATGDSKTLSRAPAGITVAVRGEWSVDAAGGVEQVMITLQATVNGETADLATDRVYDATSGTYDMTADVIADHRDVTATDFMPAETGADATTDIDVRVVVAAVRDGSVEAEASVTDTATVTVTRAGVDVAVGGTGDVTIDAAD